MKNSEILSSLKAGMSVELADGSRYDVVCDKKNQLKITKHFHSNYGIPLTEYYKDGRCSNRSLCSLDIVSIYADTECSPKQKPIWRRKSQIQRLDDLKNGMYVIFRNGTWAVVEREKEGFWFISGIDKIEDRFQAFAFDENMHYTSDNNFDIVEVWQSGKCIWREEE